jgi:hypothetical protein
MLKSVATTRGWTAAFAAAILAAVATLAIVGSANAQSASDLRVGSATVAPGATVTIPITVDANQVGSYRVDVEYDGSLVTATACTSEEGVCSVNVVGANTVRINGTNLSGITGQDTSLGTITFTAGQATGTAALTVDTETLLVSDTSGGGISVTPTNGAITIAQATPSPTPAPATPTPTGGTATATATGTRTATPGALPQTGADIGDDSSASMLTWLLAASGLVIVASGAWAVARARREN